MNRFLTIALSFLMSSVLLAGEEETRLLSDFSSVTVKGRFQVSLIESDQNSVKITPIAEGVNTADIITKNTNGKLEIYSKKKSFKDKDFHITLYYKAGSVKSFNVKNEAELFTEPGVVFSGDVIDLSCNFGGKIYLDVDTKKISIVIKQGGSIKVKGKAVELVVTIATGGRISGSELKCEKADVKITMGGDVILNISEYLNVKITSGGNVKYRGTPDKVDQKITMGGTLKKIK